MTQPAPRLESRVAQLEETLASLQQKEVVLAARGSAVDEVQAHRVKMEKELAACRKELRAHNVRVALLAFLITGLLFVAAHGMGLVDLRTAHW